MSVSVENASQGRLGQIKSKRIREAVVALAPFVVFLVAYVWVPRHVQDSEVTTLIYVGINVLLALGLNLLMGYAGQISLGHAAFFGIGAYTSAILTLRPIPGEVIPGFSVGVGVMAGCAMLISLTKASGWRLAVAIGVMVAWFWAASRMHLPVVVCIPVMGVAMAALGLAYRTGWVKGAIAGLAAGAVTLICQMSLQKTLDQGGASPWSAMLVGVLFTGLVAYLIASQVLRLKGHYLGMATLGFGIIVEIVFRQWTAVTGGSSDGIYGIPPVADTQNLPGFAKMLYHLAAGGGAVDDRKFYLCLVWAFVLVALVLSVNIVRSRIGRAFRAVHGSEVAAESLGVDTGRYKVQVFVLSAAFASLAGSLHAHNAGIGYIHPGEFGFMVSVQLLVMVVVGGMASVWGSLFGAAAIQLLKNWLLNLDKANHQFLGLTLKGLDPIVFGAVLIGVMIVLPQGLVRGLTDLAMAPIRNLATARGKKTE